MFHSHFPSGPEWSNRMSSSSPHKYVLLAIFDYGPVIIPARLLWTRDTWSGFLTNKGHLFLQRCFSKEAINIQLLTPRSNWFLEEPYFFLYTVRSELPSRQESLDSRSGMFCSEERNEFLEAHDTGPQQEKGKALISILKMFC